MDIDKIIDQVNYNVNEQTWYEIQDDLEELSKLAKRGLILQALFDTFHEEGWIRIGDIRDHMYYEGVESN